MPSHELREVESGILLLTPGGPLVLAGSLAMQQGGLRGILIHEKALRAWSDLGALLAHLQAVKQRYRDIAKVAVVADRDFATVIPFIANHFIHAQVKHFDRAHNESAAWDWLADNSHWLADNRRTLARAAA